MARLRNPEAGTVVTVGEPLASNYVARGWVDADAEPVEDESVEPEAEPEIEPEPEVEPVAEPLSVAVEAEPATVPKRRGRPPKNRAQ